MEIAMFGHKHIFTNEGGIEVVVSELVKRMAKNNIIIVYERNELDKPRCETYVPEEIKENIEIKYSPTISSTTVNAQMSSFFSTMGCVFGRQDIVHVHAEGQCVFLPLLKLAGKKVVVTIHGIDWMRAKWGKFAKWYIHLGEKMAVRYANEIVVLSPEMKEYFKKEYNRETKLIRNGVSIRINNEYTKIIKYGIYPNRYILYIGRFAPEKRIDLLYEAFEKMKNKENIKLVLAGLEDDAVKERDWYKKAKQNTSVIFVGHVGGAFKDQLITNCSAFVLPSDIEGMSISLLEGLGYGCQVIASDIHENRHIMSSYGVVFKKGDSDDLAEKLDEAVSKKHEPDKDQIEFIRANYDWDHVTEETLDLYYSVVSGCDKSESFGDPAGV